MALVLKDRVKETSTTAGTGTITLDGAVTGFQSFAAVGNGNSTYYAIVDNATGAWEVGIGTYTASGTTLSRTTVLSSSSGGALVTFTSNPKDVFVTYPSERGVWLDSAGNVLAQYEFNTINATTANLTTANITAGTVSTTPSANTDIANKQYVDGLVTQGISYHEPVFVESPNTTGNLNATYNNGASGVGATLTNAGTQVALTVDGVLMTVGKRVLVYNQTAQAENGVYEVTTVGDGSTNWVLTRTTDADTYGLRDPNALGYNDAFFVTNGNTGAGETYVCTTTGVITFGTTAITFAQISSAQIYSAGTGLTLTNTTFSLTSPVATTLGGTGLTAFTANGVVYASSTSALTTGSALTFNGTNLSTTGQFISTQTGSSTTDSGQVFLNGATSNRVDFNTNGVAAPALTTRSAGTKLTLYPSVSGSSTDYAMGVEAGALWSSVPGYDAGQFFKWYGAATQVASLSGQGEFTAVSFSGAGTGLTGTASGLSIGGNAATATSATSATTATTATNVAGGASNQLVYQTSAGTTAFATAPTTSSTYLYWNGSALAWGTVAQETPIAETNQTISSNYTLTTAKNGFSVGPVTINSGVTVTVGSGQRWLVV